MDAVYLFGAGGEEELRYSLRSISNLRQVDRVVVAGEHPAWLAGQVLRVTPDRHPNSRHANTWANLLAACLDDRLSDEFVLMNDDFFALQPVGAIPIWHAGPLSASRLRTAREDSRRDDFLHVMTLMGIPGRLSYERHIPMVMHRRLMASLMRSAILTAHSWSGPHVDPPVWKRTLYGNVAHPGVGELHDDVKIRGFDDVPAPADLFVSTSDFTWRRGAVGRWLRARFAEPCRYERG